MRHTTFSIGTLLVAGALLASPVMAGKLYKWIDENGNVSYQDTPPPEGNEYEATELSDRKLGKLTAEDSETKLDDVARQSPITLYVVTECDTCDFVRLYLNKRGIPFTDKNVESSMELKQELLDKAKRMQVPATVVGEKVVFGYRKEDIESALTAAGYPPAKPAKKVASEDTN